MIPAKVAAQYTKLPSYLSPSDLQSCGTQIGEYSSTFALPLRKPSL